MNGKYKIKESSGYEKLEVIGDTYRRTDLRENPEWRPITTQDRKNIKYFWVRYAGFFKEYIQKL